MDAGPTMTEPARGAKPAPTDCIFSVDVEDWFHIPAPSEPPLSQWDSLPSRVGANFRELLRMFAERRVRVTCFFLGWVAERFPDLVKEAAEQGHEIACHSYAHRLVYEMRPEEFLEDARRAKGLIEDAGGAEVLGYRAPCFSVTERTPWFFERLAEAGFRYDSSVFPGRRRFGGMASGRWEPHPVSTRRGVVREFPISLVSLAGRPCCFSGGGYLRLFPYGLIRRLARRVRSSGRPLIFYVHPREIDPTHPRLKMGPLHRFKSYVNIGATRAKIDRILCDFPFATFSQTLTQDES